MIVAINTVGPVFDFDISSGMPKSVVGIEGAKGGLSGSPIFHTALTDVATISSQVQIPVIGCGGVSSVEHVVKMLMAGAQAVQLYTSAHVLGVNAPQIFTKLNQQLIGWLTSNGYRGVEEIKGFALPLLSQPTTLKVVVPQVLDTQCVGCDLCVPVCLPGSISILEQGDNKASHVVLINESSCVGCGHCVSVCPTTPSALVQQRR